MSEHSLRSAPARPAGQAEEDSVDGSNLSLDIFRFSAPDRLTAQSDGYKMFFLSVLA